MNAPDRITLGLHPNMPSEQYHRIAAMSAGGLKRMRQSPAHFYGKQLDPNRPQGDTEPTPAMKAGTLFHVALFEPDAIAERYIVKPDGMSFASKDGKAWRDALPAGIEVTDADALAKARAQARNVRASPDIAALMSDGMAEASAFWIDEQTGELCKCRPDWCSPTGDGVVLIDGKSCQDASPDGFARTAWNMGYLHTAAWYIDGYQAATGQRVHGYVFAAVEHDWPHVAAPYMVPDDVLDLARADNRRLLNLYAECKRTGNWPGYSAGISLITLPVWAQRALENSQ
jgi:exodeoxyribonuclease VIII